ncbi:MAG: hypothetical protein LBQ54_13525 [Planctomycetaceae bacterium]|nr:hypothetical protein [Planctomycetaceae bacterium]
MNQEENCQNVYRTAFVVLTLIAAGEKNHPSVKKGLRFLLDSLDANTVPTESFGDMPEVPEVIPFKTNEDRVKNQHPHVERLRIFNPETERRTPHQRIGTGAVPKIRIFVEKS